MYCNCSPTLIRLLRRHLPRRGRQSAAAGTGGQSRPPLQKRRGGNIAGVSERREQSAETFREVGMDGTDRGRPEFSEKILGLRSALCPLSFLGRLNPFFSFWQRKKRTGSKRRSFGCGGTYGDGLLVLLDID